MPFSKLPEGYVPPGYVIVTLYTGRAEPVLNVYGMHATRAEALKERKQMLRDSENEHGPNHLRDLSIFVRPVHDIPQMNRLLDKQESK